MMEQKTATQRENKCMRFLHDLQEKQATRPLYEQTFPDSRAYTDFYYNEKCRDNVIVVKEEQAEPADEAQAEPGSAAADREQPRAERRILSMAHLNPYLLSVRGLPVRTYMLAAVATVPGRRREGHMRDILNAAFGWLAEQDVPFVILLPVEPAIYEPFGFETVCGFTEKEPAQEVLAAEYDIYILPDRATAERRAKARAVEEALAVSGEHDEDWPEDPVIMARVTNAAAFDRMAGQALEEDNARIAQQTSEADAAHTAGQLFDNDAARLAWLRGLKICISEGV